jgi:hypothetical protein
MIGNLPISRRVSPMHVPGAFALAIATTGGHGRDRAGYRLVRGEPVVSPPGMGFVRGVNPDAGPGVGSGMPAVRTTDGKGPR